MRLFGGTAKRARTTFFINGEPISTSIVEALDGRS